jgi:hypothetical protein
VNDRDVAYSLAISRGVVALRVKHIEALDNRSLESGCRPYLCGDFDRSIHEVWEMRHGDD